LQRRPFQRPATDAIREKVHDMPGWPD